MYELLLQCIRLNKSWELNDLFIHRIVPFFKAAFKNAVLERNTKHQTDYTSHKAQITSLMSDSSNIHAFFAYK